MTRPTFEHGTHALYQGGCRCTVCVAHMSAYKKAWRARRRNDDDDTATDDRPAS